MVEGYGGWWPAPPQKALGDDRLLQWYTDATPGITPANDHQDVHGRLLGVQGTPLGGAFPVHADGALGLQTAQAVQVQAGGCFTAFWDTTSVSGNTAGEIKGQIFNANGSLQAAKEQFLAGNPVYEAGGTVEVRELPRS
ncbi:hypothetical protein [Acidovorax sp. A1169]|uniref:hypothetical protein n=1 Tax=Acidovorax sp. A1169 TaxID=3059524 RepID=UPI002737EF4B|nr:hypothetical protein [Acidovorax sp. A1169]MDP4078400.1 hypothetical protein [Acidovorax sp. A1169]